jgi:hypothetical protein
MSKKVSLALTVLGAVTALVLGSGPAEAATVRQRADELMKLSYQDFVHHKKVKPFDWSNDGCSSPIPGDPYRAVFHDACLQHDFGYRNYGGQGRLKLEPTRKMKDWIDQNFKGETHRICNDRYATQFLPRDACYGASEAYYLAVHTFGDSSFF